MLVILSRIGEGQSGYAAQGNRLNLIISDGQFVWGPNVGQFQTQSYLEQSNSALVEYADVIEEWAAYASINPKVLITILEMKIGHLDLSNQPSESIIAEIERLTMDLAMAFYDHMYTWGERRPNETPKSIELPELTFNEDTVLEVNPDTTSGSFAIATILARGASQKSWEDSLIPSSPTSFSQTFSVLFPESDPLDSSNNLDPSTLPPDDFLQLPFPLGADWTFNGTHSWHGGDIGPDRSSMDFSTNWPRGSTLPDHYTVASHDGIGYVHAPSRTSLPCWIEVNYEMNPGEIWTTSYYHLLNLGDPGDRGLISRNESLGKIGVEVCNGGFASSAHVHFTLRYNGAFFDLDDVKLSGWTVHSGPDPYYSGYIERDGEILYPYSRLINDYDEYFGHGLDHALFFHGDMDEGGNRLQIQIDDPDQDIPGPPADVGAHDFVVEWWMKTQPGVNTASSAACATNDNWKDGNIIFDRSRSTGGSEWGVSILGGKLAFGVSGGGGAQVTLCSSSSVDDGEWHHIAIQRNRWEGTYPDGQMWIFIDGRIEASVLGPKGDISYPDDAIPGDVCGPSLTEECINLDPYLLIGAGKGDRGSGFTGLLDDLRFSWWLRYFDNFEQPPGFHIQDMKSVSILRFNEGSGDILYDTAGYDGGTSNAVRILGGNPEGPQWVLSQLFVKNPLFLPLFKVDKD
jgi:LasA protease